METTETKDWSYQFDKRTKQWHNEYVVFTEIVKIWLAIAALGDSLVCVAYVRKKSRRIKCVKSNLSQESGKNAWNLLLRRLSVFNWHKKLTYSQNAGKAKK